MSNVLTLSDAGTNGSHRTSPAHHCFSSMACILRFMDLIKLTPLSNELGHQGESS